MAELFQIIIEIAVLDLIAVMNFLLCAIYIGIRLKSCNVSLCLLKNNFYPVMG